MSMGVRKLTYTLYICRLHLFTMSLNLSYSGSMSLFNPSGVRSESNISSSFSTRSRLSSKAFRRLWVWKHTVVCGTYLRLKSLT